MFNTLLVAFILVLYFVVHLPLVITLVIGIALWIIWKLKYIILAFVGIEMLIGNGEE